MADKQTDATATSSPTAPARLQSVIVAAPQQGESPSSPAMTPPSAKDRPRTRTRTCTSKETSTRDGSLRIRENRFSVLDNSHPSQQQQQSDDAWTRTGARIADKAAEKQRKGKGRAASPTTQDNPNQDNPTGNPNGNPSAPEYQTLTRSIGESSKGVPDRRTSTRMNDQYNDPQNSADILIQLQEEQACMSAKVESLVTAHKEQELHIQQSHEQLCSQDTVVTNLGDRIISVKDRVRQIEAKSADSENHTWELTLKMEELQKQMETLTSQVNLSTQRVAEWHAEATCRHSVCAELTELLKRAERDGIASTFDKLVAYLAKHCDFVYETHRERPQAPSDQSNRGHPHGMQQQGQSTNPTNPADAGTYMSTGGDPRTVPECRYTNDQYNPHQQASRSHQQAGSESPATGAPLQPSAASQHPRNPHHTAPDPYKVKQYQAGMRTICCKHVSTAYNFISKSGSGGPTPIENLVLIENYLALLEDEENPIWSTDPVKRDQERGQVLVAAGARKLSVGLNPPNSWSGLEQRIREHYAPRPEDLNLLLSKLQYVYPMDVVAFLEKVQDLFRQHNCAMSSDDIHRTFSKLDDESLISYIEQTYFQEIRNRAKEATMEQLIIRIHSYKQKYPRAVNEYHSGQKAVRFRSSSETSDASRPVSSRQRSSFHTIRDRFERPQDSPTKPPSWEFEPRTPYPPDAEKEVRFQRSDFPSKDVPRPHRDDRRRHPSAGRTYSQPTTVHAVIHEEDNEPHQQDAWPPHDHDQLHSSEESDYGSTESDNYSEDEDSCHIEYFASESDEGGLLTLVDQDTVSRSPELASGIPGPQ